MVKIFYFSFILVAVDQAILSIFKFPTTTTTTTTTTAITQQTRAKTLLTCRECLTDGVSLHLFETLNN